MDREKSTPPPPSRRGVAFTLLTAFLAVAFTLFVAIPILALLLYVSPGTLVASLSDPVVTDAIRLSLITSTVATAIVIVFGTPLAFLNTRTDYPGRNLVETLTDLPIVLPPAVAGLGLLLAFGRFGLIGQYLAPFGITIAFTTLAVVMAQTFVAAPFFLRQARTSFGEVDPAYEAAARSLGASPAYTFRRVTVPLAAEGLVSGAIIELRPRPRRVRRDDHVRRQHPGEDADDAARDLFLPSERHHGLGRPRGHSSRDLVRRHRLGTGSRSPGRADPLSGDGSGDQGRSGHCEYARTPRPTLLRCPEHHPRTGRI